MILMVLLSGHAIARVHPVHLINAGSAHDRQPSDQINQLGL